MDLRHGDCLADDGMKTIADKSIDCIICDPPYQFTENKWDKALPLDKLFKEYDRVIKDNGAIVMFGSQPFTTDLINAYRKHFRYCLVYEKSRAANFLNAKRMPLKNYEDIVVFSKKQPTYNPQMSKGKPYTDRGGQCHFVSHVGEMMKTGRDNPEGLYYPKSILKFATEQGLHTTQKPVALCEYLVKTYTNTGELVLDNCFGSGTTALACLNTGRRFVGWEKDDKYFDVAMKRIDDAMKN